MTNPTHPASPASKGATQRCWRHKKRGTVYTELFRGHFQCAGSALDDERVVVYRGEDGKIWVRPVAEFEDGRFDDIVEPTPAEALPEGMRSGEFANEISRLSDNLKILAQRLRDGLNIAIEDIIGLQIELADAVKAASKK